MAYFRRRPDRAKPWRAEVSVANGKTVSKSFVTKAEAERWAAMREHGGGGRKGSGTLADYLCQWLDGLGEMETVRPNTLSGYRGKMQTAMDSIGPIGLLRLEPADVDRWLLNLKRRGLSKSTIAQSKTILSKAMKDAMRRKMIPFNPVEGAQAPKQASIQRPDCMSVADARTYLDAITEKFPLYGAFMRVAVMTGLRRSEIGGLRWQDVDLDAAHIAVTQTLIRVSQGNGRPTLWQTSEPKSTASRRTVPVPNPVVSILRARGAEQRAQRLKAGPAWRDTGLVFTDGIGAPLNLDTLSGTVRRIKVDLGLRGQPVHGMRHLFGTSQNKTGTDVATIQAMMGHSRSTTTLDYYVHADNDQKTDAAAAMGDLFS